MTLLLIDTAVQEYETILAAAQPVVTTVLFDRAVDTFETLKEKIRAAAPVGVAVQTVGIVQHGSREQSHYRMLETQVTPATVTDAEQSDPSLNTWSELKDFYNFLKTLGATTIDLISCSLYANQGWVYVLQQLESTLELNVRASVNNTGNIASGGDWIQESDGVNIQDIYFTEDISAYTQLLFVYSWGYQNRLAVKPGASIGSYILKGDIITSPMVSKLNPFGPQFEVCGAVKGNVVYNWGDATVGNVNGTVATNSGIVSLCCNRFSACYMKYDGTVSAWGNSGGGGSATAAAAASSGSPVVGLVGVDANSTALSIQGYAALREDGSVYSWGGTSVSTNSIVSIASSGSPAVALYANKNISNIAFAALREDGSVAAFGNTTVGGSNTQAAQANNGSPVVAIAAGGYAFAALRENGTVYSWGDTMYGGSNSQAALASSGSPVVALQDNFNGFAALRFDGSVYSWGFNLTGSELANSGSPVATIASASEAFAALRENGTVYAWGSSTGGGNNTLAAAASTGSPVVAISAGYTSFVALRQNGIVYTWGSTGSTVTAASTGSPVVAICSTNDSHACLRQDGTVYTFGTSVTAGIISGITSSNPAISISASLGAFCALLADGTVRAWGNLTNGGNNTSALNAGNSGILLVKSATTRGFTTIRSTNPVPLSAANALADDLFGNYIMLSSDSTTDVTINCKAAINSSVGQTRILAMRDYIRCMRDRINGNKYTIPVSQLQAFKTTLISGASNLTVMLPVDQYFPTIRPRNNLAILEIDSFITDSSRYICIELPINIPTILLENRVTVKTLYFDGTNVRDGGTSSSSIIQPGSTIVIGSKIISEIAVGSLVGYGGISREPNPTPPVPQLLRPIATPTTMTYKWNYTGPLSLTGFTLTLSDGNTQTIQTVGSSVRDYTFQGLTTGNTYSMIIVTNYKLGITSTPATFYSAEACSPPSSVLDAVFTKLDASTLQVTWTPPSELNGGPLQGYLLFHNNTTLQPRFSIDGFKSSHIQYNIPPGTYTFGLMPCNAGGYGPRWIDNQTISFP